jgi:hypothetical protein
MGRERRRPKLVLCALGLAAAAAPGAAHAQQPPGYDVMEPPGTVLTPPQRGTIPAERPRFELRPTTDGGYVYRGAEFGARIARDGSVTFIGPKASLPPDGTDPATVGIDAVTPQDPISGDIPIAIESRPGIRFDATDEYMRLLGKDPARQQKTQFLAATFELRMRMAMRARYAEKQTALDELPRRLDALWSDPRFTPAERRHVLIAMWAELIPGADGDGARKIIRRFAEDHLPPEDLAPFR